MMNWLGPVLIITFVLAMFALMVGILVVDKRAEGRLRATYFEKRVHLKGSPSTVGICTGVTDSHTLNILILGNPPTTVQVPEGAVVMEVE